MRAEGLEPLTGRFSPADFHTVSAFAGRTRALLEGSRLVCGLDYPFALSQMIEAEVLPVWSLHLPG